MNDRVVCVMSVGAGKYRKQYELVRDNLMAYAKKCHADFRFIDDYIDKDKKRDIYSQKLLIPDYLREIHHLFDTQYGENYSLDELENTYSVSKYRICREFSKYYGASPVQYLNHKRIEEAKKLLLTTNDTIHEIGSKVGIHNTNHFINLFKRETGATPLAFKQDAPVSISELHYL